MKRWETVATAIIPDGSQIELQRHDDTYVIYSNGCDVMTSRSHGSEDAMMSLACPSPPQDACILIGGLGMGYSLSATLDLLPPSGSVIVSEIVPEVIEWNQGQLGPLAGHPLKDQRTKVIVSDVADIIREKTSQFDAVLLDVDNGVNSFYIPRNSWLYTHEGLSAIYRSIRPCGALAIWSTGTDRGFERNLRSAGFVPSTHPIRGNRNRGGHYSVLVGKKPPVNRGI